MIFLYNEQEFGRNRFYYWFWLVQVREFQKNTHPKDSLVTPLQRVKNAFSEFLKLFQDLFGRAIPDLCYQVLGLFNFWKSLNLCKNISR